MNFSNCSSIYTTTFKSHYAIFFGDYVFKAKNDNFPSQLKKLRFNTRSFCNGAIIHTYPLKDIIEEGIKNFRPFREDFINDIGLKPVFKWKRRLFGSEFQDYYGTADDKERNIPNEWKNYLIKHKNEQNFLFLHFWNTHYDYNINNFLENKIKYKIYSELGKELLNRLQKKILTINFVRKVYFRRIIELLNSYIRSLINILKENGIYDDTLIIITADHGEGLGDIGKFYPKRIIHTYNIHLIYIIEKLRNKLNSLPKINRIISAFEKKVFFHSGGFELQKEVPLLVKFQNSEFGGINYPHKVDFFDIIHTIDELLGFKLDINNNQGYSLYYLLKEGINAREKYRIEKSIKKIKLMP